MSVKSLVAVGVMQAHVDPQIGFVILRIHPARIQHLIGIRRGVNGTIAELIINAIVTVVPDPIAERIGPISTTSITYSSLRRRCACRRRRWAIFISFHAIESHNAIIKCIVWGGVVEDRALPRGARIRRI